MTREQIELRIRVVESMKSKCTDFKMLETYNRLIEKLVMMEAEDEK